MQIAKQYHAAQIAEPVATADAVQPSNPIEPTDKQADVTSNEESKLAPAFEQHLKLKAQYPDALVIVQSPIGGQYELFGTDAGVAAKKLGLTPGRIKSGSNQHGQRWLLQYLQKIASKICRKLRGLPYSQMRVMCSFIQR